jgi:hypothetical protein
VSGYNGLAIGLPLAAASVIIAWLVIRAIVDAGDSPGLAPALIPLALLAGLGMLLYASDPELAELAGIASVAVGAMATYLAQRAPAAREETVAPAAREETEPEITEGISGTDGVPPEDVAVPPEVEELGK